MTFWHLVIFDIELHLTFDFCWLLTSTDDYWWLLTTIDNYWQILMTTDNNWCRWTNKVLNSGHGPKWDQIPFAVLVLENWLIDYPGCLGWSSCLCKFGINVQKWSQKSLTFALNVAASHFLKPFFAFCNLSGILINITTKSLGKVQKLLLMAIND